MSCFGGLGSKEKKREDQAETNIHYIDETTANAEHKNRPTSPSQVCPALPNDDKSSNQQDTINEKCIDRQKARGDDKVAELSDTVKRLKKEKKEKNKEIEKLRDEHVKHMEERKTEHQRVVDNMNKTVSKQKSEIQNLKGTNEDLLTRLSAMAGARLTDNNANIADLSDVNRPTKLAEKYSELYDNEWTDAYEVLTTTDDVSECDACHILLKAFCTVYIVCKEKANEDRDQMIGAITNFLGGEHPPSELIKQFKDQRKKNFGGHTELIKKELKESFRKLFPEKEQRHDKRLKRFLNKGMELCWLMVIQDPPVSVDVHIENRNGEKYDNSSSKPYTKSGQYIDYIVWPPLYLHEGGNMLCKGIVQCKSDVPTERVEPQINQVNQEITNTKAKLHQTSEKTEDSATEETSASDTSNFKNTKNLKPRPMTDQNVLSNGKVISVVTSNPTENENISEETIFEESLKTLEKINITTMTNSDGHVSTEVIGNAAENRQIASKIDDVKNENDIGLIQETPVTSLKKKKRNKKKDAANNAFDVNIENNEISSYSEVNPGQSNESSSSEISEAYSSTIAKRNMSKNTKPLKDDKHEDNSKAYTHNSTTHAGMRSTVDQSQPVLKKPDPLIALSDSPDKVKHTDDRPKHFRSQTPKLDEKKTPKKLTLSINKAT